MATDATGFVELPAADAFRHTLGADGRESLAHMLVFPERGIAGFVYPSVRANGLAKGRASLFGPGLPEPIHEEAEAQADDDMEFDDWRTGPLRMRVREAALDWVEFCWNRDYFDFARDHVSRYGRC